HGILNCNNRRRHARCGPRTNCSECFFAACPALGITVQPHLLAMDNAISIGESLSVLDRGLQRERGALDDICGNGNFSADKLEPHGSHHLGCDRSWRWHSVDANRCSLCTKQGKTSNGKASQGKGSNERALHDMPPHRISSPIRPPRASFPPNGLRLWRQKDPLQHLL